MQTSKDSQKNSDMETVERNLTVLSELKLWDKLYIDPNENSAISEQWFRAQPVKRMLYNWSFGGADRKQLVQFINLTYDDMVQVYKQNVSCLDQPYILKNLAFFNVKTDTTEKNIQNITTLYDLLPRVIKGLAVLEETYIQDKDISTQIHNCIDKYSAFLKDTLQLYILRNMFRKM